MPVMTKPLRSDVLEYFHGHLHVHFTALRARRGALDVSAPVFALEHNLSDDGLELLKGEVRETVRRGLLPRVHWLPFVVYAAEVGYNYSGEEYWQTFDKQTPGWAAHGDRHYIRDRFYQFATEFGGAMPGGPWARHFSIISWPITHAVLPTDLQRQLARLLFEYRRSLTADLLANPALLGSKLAARSWQYSKRFQFFAQNASLLGQVAVALLVGDGDESPYLLGSTSHRIVEALSAEREARIWLQDAKSSAHRVRARGFMRPTPSSNIVRDPRAARLPAATDPRLSLTRSSNGWTAYADLPDMSPLAERLPDLHEQLGRLRARVAGSPGRPLVSGRLLFADQRIKLDKWPSPRAPFVQLEGASSAVNGILADQCVMTPGPVWLFRVRDARLAVEVRGKFVRPGNEYVVITSQEHECLKALWIESTALSATGAKAYHMRVPEPLGAEDVEMLRAAGMSVVSDVTVRPVGLVPGGWDGEGFAEWLTGEDAVVGIRSRASVSKCLVAIDGVSQILDWPAGVEEIFVAFKDLEIGSHEVAVSLIPTDVGSPLMQGSLVVSIRAPHSRPATGTIREGLMILASPAQPTLAELWDGKAALQVNGPSSAHVNLEVMLRGSDHHTLAMIRRSVALPLEATYWLSLAAGELRTGALGRYYDRAESCLITASVPNVGTATLICEREFTPLRWVITREHGVQGSRLVDNTGMDATVIEIYEFATPTRATRIPTEQTLIPAPPQGALLRAISGGAEASVILPPNRTELWHKQSYPEVPVGYRNAQEVLRLVEANHLWTTATLPADPFAQRQRRDVLRAVTSALVSLIAGSHWHDLEQHTASGWVPESYELEEGVGEASYQRSIARAISQSLATWLQATVEARSRELAGMLLRFGGRAGVTEENSRLGEFLLRLASEPGSLLAWEDGERSRFLDIALVSPVLVRAARYAVLALDAQDPDPGFATFGGWAWT